MDVLPTPGNIMDINCGLCGKHHKAIVVIDFGPWVPLDDSEGQTRSKTVSHELGYKCPCNNTPGVAKITVGRPADKKIKGITFDRWHYTGCQDK